MTARTTRLLAGTAAAGGLIAGVAATAPLASAATAEPRNQQVALVNRTGEQPALSSQLSGTAQVSSHAGRYVVFSTAAALVPSDDNDIDDVYLRDVVDGITVLVSERNGFEGSWVSSEPTISADGRYVAFTSAAANLTGDYLNHTRNVMVKDMQTGRLTLASVTSDERRRNADSFLPVISGDGRSVSFQSYGRLGPRDHDRIEDVYVRDLEAGVTRQGSLGTADRDLEDPILNGDLSADGAVVVFGTSNRLWSRNVETGTTVRFWKEPDSAPCQHLPMGSAGRPVISGNGRFAAFASCATALPGEDGQHADVYRIDLRTREIEPAHPAGDGDSYLPSLSRSGRYVGFGSEASDLVSGDTAVSDAYVADMRLGTVRRVSQAADGSGGDDHSATTDVAISGDGHALVYRSYASNLVPGDRSDLPEVFLWR